MDLFLILRNLENFSLEIGKNNKFENLNRKTPVCAGVSFLSLKISNKSSNQKKATL